MSDAVHLLLCEWGRWSRGGMGGRIARCGIWLDNGDAPNISDERAVQVDRAVIALGVDSPVLREVLELTYQKQFGVIEIGLKLRVGRYTVDKYLVDGKAFVRGYLSHMKNAA